MSEIAKSYSPGDVESKWYSAWTDNKCFTAEVDKSKDPYCIMIPPPNVTGVLTMGHVLNNTIQDILVRRARQQGKSVLWLPGTDHAGIATQTRVERSLKAEGKNRHDLGREAFVECAKEWRDTHGGIIFEQLKRLGASCDWDRSVHTLDEDYSKAVITAFVTLYERGYVYRGKRMVNWCPVSRTALSDEEVVMKSLKRVLYKVRYEVVEEPGVYLEVSTTRPETIMGDTAIAVHPEDERYKHLIGKHCWRPFPKEPIPIIADEAVELDFGTGALKVTPAHDKVDFEIGQRHNLPIVDVINPDGTLNALAGDAFEGMDRFKARKVAVEMLKELEILIGEEPYESNVGFSERADVLIEPRISDQWFLRYPKVEEAKEVVKKGLIKFYPERWVKAYLHWLDNIQDWCISRQLWWGHRIPVWYRKGEDRKDPSNWHVSAEGPLDPENWEQEEDVLDTWASSWVWPFATLGWPDSDKSKEQGLGYWYPTSDLVTGPDIIFFWVSRMIMAGLEFMEGGEGPVGARIPFNNVYFTGIIRDAQGRKMSKSLGNSPDPIDLIDKYGADGLRFGVINIAPQGQDVLFSEQRVEQGRNLCNKIWNACRFRQMSGPSGKNDSIEAILERIDSAHCDSIDEALLGRLVDTVAEVDRSLDAYDFNSASQALYAFFWTDFCDWYVEVSKAKLQDPKRGATCLAIQDLCLRQLFLLLHPYMPFITEELWHILGYAPKGKDVFIQNIKPESAETLRGLLKQRGFTFDPTAMERIARVREFISLARSLKAQCNVQSKKDVTLELVAEAGAEIVLAEHKDTLYRLIGTQAINVATASRDDCPAIVTPLGTLYLELAASVDVEAERARLSKELAKLEKAVQAGRSKLENPTFVERAPENIIAGARAQLEATEKKHQEVVRLLAALQK